MTYDKLSEQMAEALRIADRERAESEAGVPGLREALFDDEVKETTFIQEETLEDRATVQV